MASAWLAVAAALALLVLAGLPDAASARSAAGLRHRVRAGAEKPAAGGAEKDSVVFGSRSASGSASSSSGPLGRKEISAEEVRQYPKPGTTLWHNGRKMVVPVLDEGLALNQDPVTTFDSRQNTLLAGENAVASAKDMDWLVHTPQTVESLGSVPPQLQQVANDDDRAAEAQARAQAREQEPNVFGQLGGEFNPRQQRLIEQGLRGGSPDLPDVFDPLGPSPSLPAAYRHMAPRERQAPQQPQATIDDVHEEFQRQLDAAEQDQQDLLKEIMMTKLQIEAIDAKEQTQDHDLVSNFYEHVDQDEEVTDDLGSIDEPADQSGRPLRFNIANRLAHEKARQAKIEAPAPSDKTPEALEALRKLRELVNT